MIIEAVGERDKFELESGKNQMGQRILKKKLCNCIGCVLSTVVYSNKGSRIWGNQTNMTMVSIKVKPKRDIRKASFIRAKFSSLPFSFLVLLSKNWVILQNCSPFIVLLFDNFFIFT